jgi:hypothetical protein
MKQESPQSTIPHANNEILPPHLRVIVENPDADLIVPASVVKAIEQIRATSVTEVSTSSSDGAAASKVSGRKLKLSPAARRMIHHHLGLPCH